MKAEDIPDFLNSKMRANEKMQRVTFGFFERVILVPVELSFVTKTAGWTALIVFLLSGIGPGIFSLGNAWERGLLMTAAWVLGVLAGAVAVPALLPWLPGRAFAVKGIVTGLPAGMFASAADRFSHRFFGIGSRRTLRCGCQLVSGNEFYRLHPLYLPHRSRTGDAKSPFPPRSPPLFLTVFAWVGGAFV